MAFLEAHLLGGEPAGDLAEELADVSDAGLCALNQQIATFLGTDLPTLRASTRTQQLDHLAALLDRVALTDSDQSSRGQITVAPTRPDDSVANDALRAASSVQMDILAMPAGSGRVTNATLRQMRHQAGWIPLSQFMASHYAHPRVCREIAQQCRLRKLAEYQSEGCSLEEAENRAQQEFIAVTYHHGKAKHKRDPYDDSPAQAHIDLSPEAVKEMAAELERHPSFQRRERKQAGWETLHAVTTRLGLPQGQHARSPAFALLCRMRKCQELQEEGLSLEDAEERVQRDYMAVQTQHGLGQQATRRIDLSPAATKDMDALQTLMQESCRKPGWRSRAEAARALGHSKHIISPLVDRLREDKLKEYQSQGATPEEAEARVQEEYIAHRQDSRSGKPGYGFTDLSPAAFQDLSERVAARASWRSCRELAEELGSSDKTVHRYALQCRNRRIEQFVGQGRSREDAEDQVQQHYIAMKPASNGTMLHISPEACKDIASAIDQSPWAKRAKRPAGEQQRARDNGR
jgi:hypothetical protein